MTRWAWYSGALRFTDKCAACKSPLSGAIVEHPLSMPADSLYHVGCLLDKLTAGPAPLDIDLSSWEGPP